MKYRFIENAIAYDGTQLRSLHNYLEHGLLGDSVVSWVGSCDISFDHMVDGEDLLDRSAIRGGKMVHFIVEVFHEPLSFAVALQRLMASIVADCVERELIVESNEKELRTLNSTRLFRREGDDLFSGERKFSISIATASPVSVLIHFAFNVNNQNTPVATFALEDFTASPAAADTLAKTCAVSVMQALTKEMASLREATCKVKWVK
jgi:hypothetical protein